MSSTSLSDIKNVLKFLRESNGIFNDSVCEIKESPIGGVGVFSTTDIDEETVLLRVPKSSIFSSSNSSIANLLFDAEIDGILALNIAFIYEITVFNEKSNWSTYLNTIKYMDENGNLYLPPSMWDDKIKQVLKNTTFNNLYDAMGPQEELQEGFEVAIDLAMNWNQEFNLPLPKGFFDINVEDPEDINHKYQKFVAVAYAISSRVFEIDNFHESALVPVADLFNHHPSDPNVKFVSLYDVCSKCGENGMCSHLLAEEAEAAEDNAKHYKESNGKSQKKTVIDTDFIKALEEHGDSSEEKSEDDSNISVSEDDDIDDLQVMDDSGKPLDPEECVDIVLATSISKNEEIFNSYGELPNPFLVARYGFGVENNPMDVLYFGKELLSMIKKDFSLKERIEWWKTEGFENFMNWFEIMREEEENESSDNEDEDISDEEHDESNCTDHDHSHGKDTHDHSNCTDHDHSHEETVQEEDTSKIWLSEIYIDDTLKPTLPFWVIARVLSMKEPEYKKFIKNIQNETHKNEHFQTLYSTSNNEQAQKFVKKLVDMKKLLPIPESMEQWTFANKSENIVDSVQCLLKSENSLITRVKEEFK